MIAALDFFTIPTVAGAIGAMPSDQHESRGDHRQLPCFDPHVERQQRRHKFRFRCQCPLLLLVTFVNASTMKPDRRRLLNGLLDSQGNLLIGQRAQRMLDDHWAQPLHPQRRPLDLRFMHEGLGDDNGCRQPPLFEAHTVVQTARCAGSSITDRREHYVIISRDFIDQFGAREPGEALLSVVVDLPEGEFLIEELPAAAE